MNISPVNNTSFGKLIVENHQAQTTKALSQIGKSPKVYEAIQDTFEKIDKKSGSDIVVLNSKSHEPSADNRNGAVVFSLYQLGKEGENTIKVSLSEEDDSIIRKFKSLANMDGFEVSCFSYDNLVKKFR